MRTLRTCLFTRAVFLGGAHLGVVGGGRGPGRQGSGGGRGRQGSGAGGSHPSGFLRLQVTGVALGKMLARLPPGLALCLLLAPLAGGGHLSSCAVPVGGGVLPGGLRVTALPSLAGAKPVQEEGGTVWLSSLVSWVVWVLFLVLGVQSRQKGGRVAVTLCPKLVRWKPWVSWRSSPTGRGTGASSLGTHWAGGTPSPPRTGHAHLRLPILGQSVQAWGPGSLWAPLGRPHIPPRCLHQLSVSRTTGPDSPPLAPVPSSAPSQGLRGAGPTQPASRRTRCCAPRHRGLAQPLNWVPPSRPLRRAAGHALLAFLHI